MLRKIEHIRGANIVTLQNAISSLPDFDGVTYVDVGAAGGLSKRWKPISGYIKYVGFEPDERSFKFLQHEGTSFKSFQIFPNALSDSSVQQKMYFCRKSEVSSMYRPNEKFLGLFPGVERFDVIHTGSITQRV